MPQYGDPVGELKHILKVMRNEKNPVPFPPQSGHEFQDAAAFPYTESGGRLVHQHDLSPLCHSTSDRKRLPLAPGKITRQCTHGRKGDAKPSNHLGRFPQHSRAINEESPPAWLATEPKVRCDITLIDEREILKDGRYSYLPSSKWTVETHRLAVDCDRSSVGLKHSRHHRHKRRLSGAVIADKRDNLCGEHGDRHVLESCDMTEVLRHPLR